VERPRGAPSGTKSGRAEKARSGQFTGDTHLSLWSAKNAGQTGLNRITQAEFSTYDWHTLAGHLIRRRTLPQFGGVFGGQATWPDDKAWDEMWHKHLVGKMRADGLKKPEAKRAATEFIRRWRQFEGRFRVKG